MSTFKGVIFVNKQAFDNVQTAVFNYLDASLSTEAKKIVTKWSNGIEAKDGSGEWLMPVDERIMEFPWNPHAIVDITKGDSKWFTNDIV